MTSTPNPLQYSETCIVHGQTSHEMRSGVSVCLACESDLALDLGLRSEPLAERDPAADPMDYHHVDTRGTGAALLYADGSVVTDWEINGEIGEPESLWVHHEGSPLVQVYVEADGSVTIAVHHELDLTPGQRP